MYIDVPYHCNRSMFIKKAPLRVGDFAPPLRQKGWSTFWRQLVRSCWATSQWLITGFLWCLGRSSLNMMGFMFELRSFCDPKIFEWRWPYMLPALPILTMVESSEPRLTVFHCQVCATMYLLTSQSAIPSLHQPLHMHIAPWSPPGPNVLHT